MRFATSEMLSHRFLSNDVEETVFGNGLTLRVNFSPEYFDFEDLTLPARGYRIFGNKETNETETYAHSLLTTEPV